jgi:hypothetical protein
MGDGKNGIVLIRKDRSKLNVLVFLKEKIRLKIASDALPRKSCNGLKGFESGSIIDNGQQGDTQPAQLTCSERHLLNFIPQFS